MAFQAFEVEVLFAFEFVRAMRITDSNSQRVHARFLHKLHRFFGMRVMAGFRVVAAGFAFIELRADQLTELALDDAVVLVCVIDDLAADFDIFLKRLVARVDHDRW